MNGPTNRFCTGRGVVDCRLCRLLGLVLALHPIVTWGHSGLAGYDSNRPRIRS